MTVARPLAAATLAGSLLAACSTVSLPSTKQADNGSEATVSAPPPSRGFAALRRHPPGRRSAVTVQLAAAAIDNQNLAGLRGGFDAGGVQYSFAFQEQTFIDHNLVQTVVVPTITVAGNASAAQAAAAASLTANPNWNAPLVTAGRVQVSPAAGTTFGGSSTPPGLLSSTQGATSLTGQGLTATTAVANGAAQTQVSSLSPALQALVNTGVQPLIANGAGSVVTSGQVGGQTSVMAALGSGGLTNLVTNTANNRLVQQTVTLNLGLTGISQLMQQAAAANVANRLSTASTLFR